jgi:hypothetical protein
MNNPIAIVAGVHITDRLNVMKQNMLKKPVKKAHLMLVSLYET